MSRIRLTMAFSRSARTRALLDGGVTIEGVDLVPCVVNPGDLFWRQLRYQEFDISELSLASLLVMRSAGRSPFTAIPAFPSRAFFHTSTVVHREAGIDRPEDLRGKRVGVAEYQQTAALWARGAFQHEFGVHPSEIKWHQGRSSSRSHATSTGFVPPDDVVVRPVPEGRSLGAMLIDRELDAIIAYAPNSGGLGLGQDPAGHAGGRADSFVDAGDVDPTTSTDVRPLFDDAMVEGRRYHRSTGIFPMNHVVAVRSTVLDEHPWLARNIFDGFERARSLAAERMYVQLETYEALGAVETAAIRGVEPAMGYGITANLTTLDAAMQFASEQGLITSDLQLHELFPPSVLEL